MDEPICLTADEVEALRKILSALAVIEQRPYLNDRGLLEISRETWHEMLVRPAQGLARLRPLRLPIPYTPSG